ncbi:hypothetical protein [Microbispora sp. NPDC049633]|uniref:hypothetical protein n=1 Tax=Microbispora sp. NPDC049633 TaxID=3154355 RepID=UPI003426D567
MSDFWSRKLAAVRPAAPAAPYAPAPAPQAPPTSLARPWWDPTPAPAPQAPQMPVQGVPDAEIAKHLAKAPSSQMTDRCGAPGCGSTNFGAPPGTQARARCFDCGWPLVQAGSGGVGMPSGQAGQVTPARQIHDGTSNYNPAHIIAHVK